MRTKPLFRYRLSEAEKDALLIEQSVLIERLTARISELEAAIDKASVHYSDLNIR